MTSPFRCFLPFFQNRASFEACHHSFLAYPMKLSKKKPQSISIGKKQLCFFCHHWEYLTVRNTVHCLHLSLSNNWFLLQHRILTSLRLSFITLLTASNFFSFLWYYILKYFYYRAFLRLSISSIIHWL